MPNDNYANEPNNSRAEFIIQSILDGTEYDEPAQSRIEYLLKQLKAFIAELVTKGVSLIGETSTALVDNATTNPITVDGESYTAQPNDAVIYGHKEFLFDGTKWHEFGDLSGLSSKDIGAMTNYVKAVTAADIDPTDTLNQAIGKLEKRVSDNKNNFSSVQAQADWNSNTGVTNLFDFDTWTQGLTAFRGTVSISENSVTVQATSNDAYTSTNTLDIPVKPNTKYILTWDSTATNEHNGNVYIFTNSITSYKKAIAEKFEFTTNSGDTSVKARVGVDVSGDSITYSNIMLRPGTITDDTYQPYAMSNAELTAKEQANENNILFEQAKTTGMSEGGSDYITVGGIRVYVSATAPTGAQTGDLWIGG